MLHKFETDSSIWMLDDASMMATRLPKSEAPNHPYLSYDKVGKPVEFTYAHVVFKHGYNRLCIHYKENPNGSIYPYSAYTGALDEINKTFTIGDPEVSDLAC